MKWWESDFTEELTIVCAAGIAVCAMVVLGTGAGEIVSGIAGGLVGYLTRGQKDGRRNP